MKLRSALLAAALFASPSVALAGAPIGGMHVVTEATIPWGPPPPVLAPGLQFAVISGEPTKPGPFVFRVKAPAGYVVAPHTHPTDENLTVISGTMYQGMGDKLDRSHGTKLAAGDFVHLPAGMAHSIWSDAPAEVQISGTGPFDIRYVDPADDPRNKTR